DLPPTQAYHDGQPVVRAVDRPAPVELDRHVRQVRGDAPEVRLHVPRAALVAVGAGRPPARPPRGGGTCPPAAPPARSPSRPCRTSRGRAGCAGSSGSSPASRRSP